MKEETKKSNTIKKFTERHQEVAMQSLLAEYHATKNEIVSLLQAGDTIIGINIFALSAIFGAWLPNRYGYEKITILLIISVISSVLGLIWLKRQERIVLLNGLIIKTITPDIRSISNNADLFKSEKPRRISFIFWESLFFSLPSLVGSLMAIATSINIYESLWVNRLFLDIVSTSFFIILPLVLLGFLVVKTRKLGKERTTIKEHKS